MIWFVVALTALLLLPLLAVLLMAPGQYHGHQPKGKVSPYPPRPTPKVYSYQSGGTPETRPPWGPGGPKRRDDPLGPDWPKP